jgi:SAM-dependent methyltransferase
MERIRAEVAERKRQSGPNAPVPEPLSGPTDFAVRCWTARELLELPAADFARATHLAFLGREPSPEEFVRLRDRLLVSHVGRMRILREFRGSLEARAHRLAVKGFRRESAWDRIYWSPPAKLGRSIGRLISNICRSPRRIREYIARIETLERCAAESAAAIRGVKSTQAADRRSTARRVNQLQEQVTQLPERLAATKQSLDKTIAERAGTLEHQLAKLAQETSIEIKTNVAEIHTSLVTHWRTILDQKLRMDAFLSKGRQDRPAGGSAQTFPVEEKSHLLDPLYLSFEDRHRGTRNDIKDRQRVYLPRVEACVTETGLGPVFDIGCGRGEWLELLNESGIAARGYDVNRIAVEECRQRGLDVVLADAIGALAGLPDGSASAITGFHIIEHLAFEVLVELFDHSWRVLRPGGLIIMETPNPANVIVAAEKFYFDPTHRNPLPSELTAYLLESRGFLDIEIVPLHPVTWPSRRDYDDPMLVYVQNKLFGPQDYAAIGRKIS